MMTQTRHDQNPLAAMILAIQRVVVVFAFAVACTVSFSTAALAAGGSSEPDFSQKLKTAERLIYKENYAAAIKQLKEITKAEPDNADAWNFLGFAYRKSDNLEQASLSYEKALTAEPEHKGALEYQGELFIRLGDQDAAQRNLETLKQLCPSGCEEFDLLQEAMSQS